ncbi:MAG: septal ring lytic transglycosylase RlpA family protein, partial [Betaproteobacteria bacterium]
TPKWEPLHRFANRPYSVLGRDYVPATELRPYRERGTASWYGRKFHNQRTSIGETYDMYAMTAAHPTLPLPSYARVTHLQSGRSVIVRVNDRGPFLHGRIIDLSYAAAWKLAFVDQGSAQVEVEAILPDSISVLAARAPPAPIAVGAVTAAPVNEPEMPVRMEAGEFYLQLGGFTSLENAENFLSVTEFQLSGSGYSGPEIRFAPRVRARDNMFRVELGPYSSRELTQRAAAELKTRFGITTATLPR